MKRFFDILVSSIFLLMLMPVFFAVALLIRRDKGPVFFVQERVGINGVPFKIYKFRSMIVNSNHENNFSTSDGDPRITNVGRFIRKTSIDELPQLINVLKGEMSVVGPRPNVYQQKNEYTEEQWDLRNSVLPGITGLAQATMRSEATWQERFDLDIEYIRNKSFSYDMKILIMTIRQVVFRGGN